MRRSSEGSDLLTLAVVFFEGTSVQKSTKLSGAGSLLSNITWLCPNLRELIAIYYSTLKSSSSSSHSDIHAKKLDSCTNLQEFLSAGIVEGKTEEKDS